MGNTLLVIGTALFSGIVATLVTIWVQKRERLKNEKVRILTALMTTRYDSASEDSVDAINMIDVVFYKSPKVRSALREFLDATNAQDSPTKIHAIEDKHLRLLEVMAEDIGYREIKWEDIKQYYYPQGLAEQKQDETVLRRMQIKAAFAQVKGTSASKESAQSDPQTALYTKVLLKALENPDGFAKLVDAAEKAQKWAL